MKDSSSSRWAGRPTGRIGLRRPARWEKILTEALSRLDPGSRWMVLLSDVEGFSYEEIAALADVPVGTVKSRLHRARMAMRRLLSPVT